MLAYTDFFYEECVRDWLIYSHVVASLQWFGATFLLLFLFCFFLFFFFLFAGPASGWRLRQGAAAPARPDPTRPPQRPAGPAYPGGAWQGPCPVVSAHFKMRKTLCKPFVRLFNTNQPIYVHEVTSSCWGCLLGISGRLLPKRLPCSVEVIFGLIIQTHLMRANSSRGREQLVLWTAWAYLYCLFYTDS